MKVILRQDFETLGKIGEVVDVKAGYARNFLFPRGLAYAALKGNIRALDDEKKAVEEGMPNVIAMIDKLAKRGIIHKNKAAHLKSKLTKAISSKKAA